MGQRGHTEGLWACTSRLARVTNMCKQEVARTVRKVDQGQIRKGLEYKQRRGDSEGANSTEMIWARLECLMFLDL